MASYISPGDVVALARGVYRLYKKFVDAPEEMKQLGQQVKQVEVFFNFLQTSPSQLEFLESPQGSELAKLLRSHLKKLKRILRQVKDVGKQWQRAKKNFLRRVPFTFYTMRAVPNLRSRLEEELSCIDRVRNWASQTGVNLGPAAIEEIKLAVAAELVRAKAKDKEIEEAEQKRRAACSALKRTATLKRPDSSIKSKTEALKELRQSGLPTGEAKILSELYQAEIEKASAVGTLETLIQETSSRKSVVSSRTMKSAKSTITTKTQKKITKDGPESTKKASTKNRAESKENSDQKSKASNIAAANKVVKQKTAEAGKTSKASLTLMPSSPKSDLKNVDKKSSEDGPQAKTSSSKMAEGVKTKAKLGTRKADQNTRKTREKKPSDPETKIKVNIAENTRDKSAPNTDMKARTAEPKIPDVKKLSDESSNKKKHKKTSAKLAAVDSGKFKAAAPTVAAL